MKWKWAFELILSLAAVGGTAFLTALIARYDMGTTTATIRVGALSTAALVLVAIAGGTLLNGVAGVITLHAISRPCRLLSGRARSP